MVPLISRAHRASQAATALVASSMSTQQAAAVSSVNCSCGTGGQESARGLRAFGSREVGEHRRVVAFDQKHELLARARERGVDKFTSTAFGPWGQARAAWTHH